ncbi:MAG: hypothetical protein ABSG68_04145 [Thermoguttaceae bacterium]
MVFRVLNGANLCGRFGPVLIVGRIQLERIVVIETWWRGVLFALGRTDDRATAIARRKSLIRQHGNGRIVCRFDSPAAIQSLRQRGSEGFLDTLPIDDVRLRRAT